MLLSSANGSRTLTRPGSSNSTPLRQQNATARSPQHAGVPAAAALAAAGPSDSLPQLQQQQQKRQQQSSHSTRTCIAQQQEHQCRYSSNPRLLTAHIKRSNSWQQVSGLLSAAGAAANHIHLTAAVTHCAQLHQGTHKQQKQQQQLRFACSITDRLLHQHAAALELRHSANLVWALAVLSSGAATDPDSSSSSREQRLQHLVEQLLELQTQQLQLPALQQEQSSGYGSSSSVPAGSTAVKPQDLANTVWALATLSQAPPEPWLCCFWGLSDKLLQQQPQHHHHQQQQQQQCCSLQELCNMAWAVAKLQLQPPGPWLHALLGATQHTLNAATTQGQQQQQPLTSTRGSNSKQPVRLAQALSNLAYAVGKLGCRPSDDWVSVFFAASLPQLHNCSHVQLSMLLWGLAEWGSVTVTAGAAAAAAGGVSFEGWLPVYAACVQQQLPTYSDQALVNTAASCYKLLLLTQHACASTSSQQQQQQRLVAMVTALQQLLGAVLETAAGRVQMLPVSSASALLWASAGMRGCQQQQQQEQQAGSSSSSGSIHSWLRGYIQAHMAHPTEAAAAADVLQLLWLAAKLRECPASDAWLQQQCALLQQQPEHLTLAQLSKLTWSLAELLECTAAAAAADCCGGRASHSSSSSSGTDHPQHQQQHEVVWQHLNSLACTLLQLLPQRLADMSPQELVESTAAAARIVAVLQHGLRQQGLVCPVPEQQQQEEWALQQAACILLPVSAAAALPCTAALQPHHLELLAQAMRLLLKHSTPQLAPPAAAAAAAWGSGGVMSSQQLSAVHRWLRAAADAVAAAGLPAAATAQVSMQLLALGQAAVRVAARAAAAAAAAAAATAAAASEEHAPSLHPARPASSSHQLEHQQQQQQLQLQRQRQKHHDWHPVLEQLLSCVGQLEGEQALQAAECSVRSLVTLPPGCLCELLYALQAAIPSFSPHQLLRLLRLLPAWRVTPPAAVKAKQAVVHRWLSASRYVILLQQQQQPGAAHGSSAGAAAAAVAAASQLQFVVAAVLGLEAAHVRPPQPWLQLAAPALAQHLSAQRLLAEQHSYHHQQQQQQDASGAGPSSQAAGVLLSPETLSRLVLALSRLGCQLEWDSWEAGVLLQATQDVLPHMDRSQLVRVLHGLTKMGAVPDSTWLAAFYDRIEAAPGAFHVSGFGMVVWALAKSGAKPHPAWLAALLDSTYGWGGSTVAAAAGAAEPGTSCSGSNAASEQWTDSSLPVPQLQRQQQLRPQHLANMLCAFAKLGFTPGARWMSWFRAELERTSGGQLQELDHFHIEWAWQELNHQYRMAANSSSSGGAGSTAEEM